jgi:hypothetical protein
MSTNNINALKGYEYFIHSRGKASIDQINVFLKAQGWGLIHQRTYNHYRSLIRYGFRNYIPINQFDVSRSLGRLQIAADRRRYARERTEINALISFDRKDWVECVVTNKSLVGFSVVSKENIKTFGNSRCWIRIDSYYEIPTVLVWYKFDKENKVLCMGLRAFEFIAKYEESKRSEITIRPTGIIEVIREKEGTITWGTLFLVLSKTDELISAISEMLITINDELHTNIHFEETTLQSIEFGSPGGLTTKVDLGVAEILKTLIEKFQYWSLDKKRYIEENREKELKNVDLEIEVLRNALHLRREAFEEGLTTDAVRVILDPIKKIFNRDKLPEELFDNGTLPRGILSERALPALAELLAGDDSDFKIDVVDDKQPLKITKNN